MRPLPFALALLLAAAGPLGAVDVTGSLHAGGGVFDPENRQGSFFGQGRLLIRSRPIRMGSLTAFLAAEGHLIRTSESNLPSVPPGWPETGSENLLSLERASGGEPGDRDRALLRVTRAYLRWAPGALELSAGRRDFNWGTSRVFRPVDWFHPLPVLAVFRDHPPGSDTAAALLHFGEAAAAEGAVRWLKGGKSEAVLRYTQGGLGTFVAPSAAFSEDGTQWGLETSATLKGIQLRFEGAARKAKEGPDFSEWVAGFTLSGEETRYHVEVLRDGGGRTLGEWSTGRTRTAYAALAAEMGEEPQRLDVAVLRSFDGGRTLFWPRFLWRLSEGWSVDLQMHWMLGRSEGPLARRLTQLWAMGVFEI